MTKLTFPKYQVCKKSILKHFFVQVIQLINGEIYQKSFVEKYLIYRECRRRLHSHRNTIFVGE